MSNSTLVLVRNGYLLKKATDWLVEQGLPYIGRLGYPSVRHTHVQAIIACETLRRGATITGNQLKHLYDQLKVGYYLARGGKARVSLIGDKDVVTLEDAKTKYGLQELTVWYDMLEGIDYATRLYYRSILSNGYKLSTPPKIRLSTIHGVKGGEANHVILFSDMAAKSYDEYSKDPDDERRVAYVAVTRSKNRLSIIHPYTPRYFPYIQESSL